jgi:hypothetical protein
VIIIEGKIIALFLVALLGGLGGGFGLSYIVYQPQIQNLLNTTANLQNLFADLNSTLVVLQNMQNSTGAGTNNQVQVSGAVIETQNGTIEFSNSQETYGKPSVTPIQSTSLIVNGRYSVTLLGGHSYSVHVNYGYRNNYYSIYVPLGVTTFAADF